ncbi:hypothetical protein N181_31485 [Sinorhizobium fredii USDA 205]|nr:hypothetical protein N181_31485 [Sinorhizobium fredii USDA 205]
MDFGVAKPEPVSTANSLTFAAAAIASIVVVIIIPSLAKLRSTGSNIQVQGLR